jgi:mutator protein MutT
VSPKRNKPHYHVTAGLIWQNGRVLITKRPEGSHLAGLWEFPGGKQEARETLRECLEREMREELGIGVRAGRHLVTVEHEYETKFITLHFFLCTGMEGRPVTLEGQEARWVRPEELTRYAFPPPDREIIESLTPRGIGEKGNHGRQDDDR